MKSVKVILSKDAKEIFDYLTKESQSSKIEKTILNSLKQKIDFIKSNPHYGNPISKKLFPKEYQQKYAITNLFRIELPNYWRRLYTLQEGETKVQIISFVLDIINHKDYNKKFGYK